MAPEHSPLLPLSLTCPSCTTLENIIRGKTERRKLYLSVFCKQHSLFYTSGSPFFSFFFLLFPSQSLFRLMETRKEEGGGGGELPLWEAKVLPVHCAAGCQVKLGSTGSVSVKKSILDGRLLPGKSVLIPGLILDQRLQQNDMPLAWKWTHSAVEIGWKCVRWLPRLLVLTVGARGGLKVWLPANEASISRAETTPPWPPRSGLKAFVVRRLQMPSNKVEKAFCRQPVRPSVPLLSPVFLHKAWGTRRILKIKQQEFIFFVLNTEGEKRELRCIIDGWIMRMSWRVTFFFLFDIFNRKPWRRTGHWFEAAQMPKKPPQQQQTRFLTLMTTCFWPGRTLDSFKWH